MTEKLPWNFKDHWMFKGDDICKKFEKARSERKVPEVKKTKYSRDTKGRVFRFLTGLRRLTSIDLGKVWEKRPLTPDLHSLSLSLSLFLWIYWHFIIYWVAFLLIDWPWLPFSGKTERTTTEVRSEVSEVSKVSSSEKQRTISNLWTSKYKESSLARWYIHFCILKLLWTLHVESNRTELNRTELNWREILWTPFTIYLVYIVFYLSNFIQSSFLYDLRVFGNIVWTHRYSNPTARGAFLVPWPRMGI